MTKSYILKSLSQIFFSIFFTLFIITSIIFFIKIASMTSIVRVNFWELLELFLYVLPNILFFTIPVSFFASAVVTLSRLSFDSELIVLFSLGLTPNRLKAIFRNLTLILTLTLLLLSLGLIPLAQQLNKNFIYQKRMSANLNIKATEFGQKFGDWLLFIDSSKDSNFEGVALFSNRSYTQEITKTSSADKFIIAKEAKVNNEFGNFNFTLSNGKGFLIEDNLINQINFESMKINDTTKIQDIRYLTIVDYWLEGLNDKKRAKYFTLFVLISLFPALSLYLILGFGILNPRYDKNHTYFYILLTTVTYYIVIYQGATKLPFYSIFIISPIWTTLSYFIYRRRVSRF